MIKKHIIYEGIFRHINEIDKLVNTKTMSFSFMPRYMQTKVAKNKQCYKCVSMPLLKYIYKRERKRGGGGGADEGGRLRQRKRRHEWLVATLNKVKEESMRRRM